jgi:hypothetical protein
MPDTACQSMTVREFASGSEGDGSGCMPAEAVREGASAPYIKDWHFQAEYPQYEVCSFKCVQPGRPTGLRTPRTDCLLLPGWSYQCSIGRHCLVSRMLVVCCSPSLMPTALPMQAYTCPPYFADDWLNSWLLHKSAVVTAAGVSSGDRWPEFGHRGTCRARLLCSPTPPPPLPHIAASTASAGAAFLLDSHCVRC